MSLKLSNCKRCGIVFIKRCRPVCAACETFEYEQVLKLCDYAEQESIEHITIQELSLATEIDLQNVEFYLKKGRLSRIVKKLAVNCKVCGEYIPDTTIQGLMCDKCVKNMGRDPKERRAAIGLDDQKVKIKLKHFDKDIMHTNKYAEERLKQKYGLNKNSDS